MREPSPRRRRRLWQLSAQETRRSPPRVRAGELSKRRRPAAGHHRNLSDTKPTPCTVVAAGMAIGAGPGSGQTPAPIRQTGLVFLELHQQVVTGESRNLEFSSDNVPQTAKARIGTPPFGARFPPYVALLTHYKSGPLNSPGQTPKGQAEINRCLPRHDLCENQAASTF